MTSQPSAATPSRTTSSAPRLPALDALRGFDMFWLIGGELLPAALFTWTGWSVWQTLAQQFEHSTWHGFAFYDLIFPLFIFISGVSLGLQGQSLSGLPLAQRRPLYARALRRLMLLVLLGVVYNHGWGTGLPADPAAVRYASVLGRIGIAWFVAAMLLWHLRTRTVVVLTAAVLLGYSLLQLQWPLTETGSLNTLLDQALLPGITYRNAPYDPEGLYSQVGAICNCLLGAFAGVVWRADAGAPRRRLLKLLGMGAALVVAACLLQPLYPLNKSLWTGSFTLLTSGISLLLLLAFDLLLGQRTPRLSLPLYWLGQNAILIYLGTSLVMWGYSVKSLFGGWISASPVSLQPLLFALTLLALQLLALRWLYQRKLFLRV
jgi:predicted acyltransferase